MIFLAFVSFSTSPLENPRFTENYLTYMPFVHGLFTVITFVLIPILIIIMSFANFSAINQSVFKGELWINCIASIIVIVWDVMQIQFIFMGGINHYRRLGKIRRLRAAYTTWEELYTNQIDPEVKKEIDEMIEKEYQYQVQKQEDKNKKKEERKTDLKRQASLYRKTDDSQQKQGTINESLLSK